MCTSSRQFYTLLEHAFMHCYNIVIYAVGTIIRIVVPAVDIFEFQQWIQRSTFMVRA
jgi:hypothetical protein